MTTVGTASTAITGTGPPARPPGYSTQSRVEPAAVAASDAAGNTHGFIHAGGAFSTVDVAGARDTQLTRIKNGGSVTGVCTDALTGLHGLTGQ